MFRYLLILYLFLFFASCQNKSEKNAADSIRRHDSTLHADSIAAAKKDSLSKIDHRYTASLPTELKGEAWDYLSNQETKDHFELTVPKGPLAETKAILRVTDSEGHVLYDTAFNALELVNGYALTDTASEASTVRYYREHVATYFDGAIGLVSKDQLLSNQPAEPEVTDAELWKSIKADPQARVFIFHLSEESDAYLVYSPKLKRLVAIAYCC